MSRFEGRVAIVTGASSGIGRATALRLGAEGATVACLDVAADACEATVAEIRDAGGKAAAFTCDVSDATSVRATVARVASDLAPPAVLCNIAGIGKFAHTHEQPVEEWDRIIAVNLTGTFLMSQAVLPHLLASGGNIVNTASTAGIAAQPYSAAYAASKGGVALLTRSMAYEYSQQGVRVNAVAPGGIETPIMQSFALPEGASPALLGKIMSPMGFGQPGDVAGLIAFLASDEARYMTGAIVTIDGGMTA